MAAEPSLHDLAREARLPRNLVLAGREGAAAEDLRDCAALLKAGGSTAAAQLLFDAAELWIGAPPETGTKPNRSTWDLAVEDLSDLITVAETRLPPINDRDIGTLALMEGGERPSTRLPPDSAWMRGGFGPALRRVLDLRGARSAVPVTEIETLMETVFRAAPFDLAALRREPAELVRGLAFNTVRRILAQRGELAKPPYGGMPMFARGERLSGFGLGLGFRNLEAFAPTAIGIDLLITEAWKQAPRERDLASTIDRFAVLLSVGLPTTAQRSLIHTLADDGRTAILTGILIRLQRAPPNLIDTDLLRDLRDAFLDLGHGRLAAEAQRRLTTVTDDHPAEQAARDELEAAWRHQEELLSADPAARPVRRVVRRSGFGSTALQRRRRFRHAATDTSAASNPAGS